MNPQVDLLGMRTGEEQRKKEKRLGYLPKKELIAEVRKIFPNATVLPSSEGAKKRQTEKGKRCGGCSKKIKGAYVAYDKYFLNKILCFQCATRASLTNTTI